MLAGPKLYPDAIEYLGIAWSWAHGAGLVDPVLYSYYLPGVAPPVSALVLRAPILPALLALPFALGADLRTVLLLHAVVAALGGALGVFVARRLGGIGAAWAFAIGFCLSFPWIFATQTPLTEALSIGLLVAIAALAERAWGAIDPRRLLLPAALCFWLLAASWLAHAARRQRPRWSSPPRGCSRRARRARRAVRDRPGRPISVSARRAGSCRVSRPRCARGWIATRSSRRGIRGACISPRDPVPASRPWRAPPPLAGGGRGPDQTTPSS